MPVLWPANVSAFFTEPGVPTTLAWNVSGLSTPSALHYAVAGYANGTRDCQAPASGVTHWTGPGALLELTLSFGQGFFEVSFAEIGQSFGVVSLPAFQQRHPSGQRDAVFSVDAALTQASGVNYRPGFSAYRSQLIESLGRVGLAAARERQSTGCAMAANGTIGEWPALNVAVRNEWAAAGVGVVDLSYETEAWMGTQPGASVVQNLSAFAFKWRKIATTYPARSAWTQNQFSYIELFNEIDSDASAGTGDQYMSAAQAVAYALHGTGVKLLCGVVTDSVHDGWRDAAANNGLLEVCDGFSFHSYRTAADEERLVGIFRNWLASRGSPSFPLLITEAGTQSDDWKSSTGQSCSATKPQCDGEIPGGYYCYNDACVGKMRPTYVEDLIYAWDLIAKAVEHKALGVQGSFAFVLFYYAEKTGSFAMTGRDGTALRALAALAQAISVLSGATYVGDLPNSGWRVFNTTHDGLVAVVSSGRPTSPNATVQNPLWSWYFPVRRLEGIDGRFMNVHCGSSGCQYENEDGLLYAYLSDAAIHVLQRHTVAGQLSALAASSTLVPAMVTASSGHTQPLVSLPLVMRYEWKPNQVQVLSGTSVGIGSAWGFRPIPANTSNFTTLSFEVSVHSMLNTSSYAGPTQASLRLEVGGVAVTGGARTVHVEPMGAVNISWIVDLSSYAATGPAASVELAVTAAAIVTRSTDWQKAPPLARRLSVMMYVGEWGCVPADTTPMENLCS
jgi:hypothetical protein